MVVVEFEDVFIKYETHTGSVMAIRGLTFNLREGESLLLMGPSGSGKTTVLKAILGLIEPVHGTIKVFGEDPYNGDPIKIRRKIGYLSQEGWMIPELTIRENAEFYCTGRGRKFNEERFNELASALNVASVLNKRPPELSGGELRRAELLMILSDEPKLLLLDEPTAMLDRENAQRVLEVLKKMLGKVTMVVTSHDPLLRQLASKELLLAKLQPNGH